MSSIVLIDEPVNRPVNREKKLGKYSQNAQAGCIFHDEAVIIEVFVVRNEQSGSIN